MGNLSRGPLLALALCVASPAVAYAQETDDETGEEAPAESPELRENVLFADLSLGVISLGYEHLFSQTIAMQIAAGIYGPWYRRDNILGGGGELRLFIFVAGEGLEGPYVSPGFRAAYVRRDGEALTEEGFAVSGRITFGYGWLLDIFVVRLGVGAQYHVLDLNTPHGLVSDDFAELWPALDIYIGLAP